MSRSLESHARRPKGITVLALALLIVVVIVALVLASRYIAV